MSWSFTLLVLAAVWALWRLSARIGELESALRHHRFLQDGARQKDDQLEAGLATLRRHVAAIAAGAPPAADQILEGRSYAEIDGAAAWSRMRAADPPALIDVRTAEEFEMDHAEGARLVPLDELARRLVELPPREKPVMFICAGGSRSQSAAEYLAGQGWQDVSAVAGGTAAWPGPRRTRSPMRLDYVPPARTGPPGQGRLGM
jgi:rhodanese-related sulfurtransferase